MTETEVNLIVDRNELQKDYSAETLTPSKEITGIWKQVHKALRGEFGEAVFRSWLKPLKLQAYYHGTLEVSVPTRFMKDWIQTHYSKRILEMCADKSTEIKRLEIVVVQGVIQDDDEQPEKNKKANTNNKPSADQFEITSPLDQRFTFDSFVVGKPNALAHAAARRVVESASVLRASRHAVRSAIAIPEHALIPDYHQALLSRRLQHLLSQHIQRRDPDKFPRLTKTTVWSMHCKPDQIH